MKVVIVESPAKAKTINQYLDSTYQVIASYGHVRDLPSKEGSVEPDQDFFMHYDLNESGVKRIKEIAKSVKSAKAIFLATDEDREGEAISWHILEALKTQYGDKLWNKLKDELLIKRIAFHEITKKAVLEAIKNPRDLDMDLVNAQQARRALDYLVGFKLSPILWRKLPGSKSAGRVQSVALRLICEREQEIEKFKSEEYWDIKAHFKTNNEEEFVATLTHINQEKLSKLSIKSEGQAKEYIQNIQYCNFKIQDLTEKEQSRNPAAPFTTSSMQQEAARKLGFSAKQTMQVAQKLYEGIEIDNETIGLITYMRTDSVNLADEAITATRKEIEVMFGKKYVPSSARSYKAKAKNAQEAHEAIRPTNIHLLPAKLKSYLDEKQYKLYDLIWKRMMACQMENAILEQMVALIDTTDGYAKFRAVGSRIKFDGFYRLYREGLDDENEEEHKLLPLMTKGDSLKLNKLQPHQHFTEAPPRFSEASLIKKLEELGIGRPSTYAPTISVLQEREYVIIDNKRFTPQERGRLVTAFLVSFFKQYVEYDFTANLENQLDDIASGSLNWKEMLHQFWEKFHANISTVQELDITHVINSLNDILKDHLFPVLQEGEEPTKCPICEGTLSLKLGRYGAFISCSNYPECKYTRQIGDSHTTEGQNMIEENGILGVFPSTNEMIFIKKGPYGFYLQRGEDEKGKKPKRITIPKGMNVEAVNLEIAIELLSLPREIGIHPTTNKSIQASIGPYGPYLLHDSKFTSLPASENILNIDLEKALEIIAAKGKGLNSILKDFGSHPQTNFPIQILKGRFGPYLKYNEQNIKIPKNMEIDTITLDDIMSLISTNIQAPLKKTKGKK